jgi:hypothetical protein
MLARDPASTFIAEMRKTLDALEKFRVDIERALGYGGHSHDFAHIVAMCVKGEADLYILPNSVIIMQLDEYPNYKAYHIFLACGKMDELMEAQAGLLMREAKMRGASKLTFAGRTGWVRQLKSSGWQHKLAVMHKDIDNVKNLQEHNNTGNRPECGRKLGSDHVAGPYACRAGLSAVSRE